MGTKIICADPDPDERSTTVSAIRDELSDLDPEIEKVGTRSDAQAALTDTTDAVVTEYEFADGTGFDLIATAREIAPDAGCVLYTDTDPDTIDTSEIRGNITEYVGKESVFGPERLGQLLRTTLKSQPQRSYPLPQDESERVAALRAYELDDPELLSSLDRITDLAAAHFDVTRSSINIINEHSQDFLACYGEATGWETMDREDSICTFTIVEDDGAMVVEDVTEDPRFASRSDTLIDMGIRSYMGANLVTSTGLVIGPLCVYDDEPRSFCAADVNYLRDLAAVAMDLIELHSHRGEA
jgi:DNA-binding NarL/FixJ family response regulator